MLSDHKGLRVEFIWAGDKFEVELLQGRYPWTGNLLLKAVVTRGDLRTGDLPPITCDLGKRKPGGFSTLNPLCPVELVRALQATHVVHTSGKTEKGYYAEIWVDSASLKMMRTQDDYRKDPALKEEERSGRWHDAETARLGRGPLEECRECQDDCEDPQPADDEARACYEESLEDGR